MSSGGIGVDVPWVQTPSGGSGWSEVWEKGLAAGKLFI